MMRAWLMDSFKNSQQLEYQRNPPEFLTLDELYNQTDVEYFKVIQ